MRYAQELKIYSLVYIFRVLYWAKAHPSQL